MDSFASAGSMSRWLRIQELEMKAVNRQQQRTNSLHQWCRMSRALRRGSRKRRRASDCLWDCGSVTVYQRHIQRQRHTKHTNTQCWLISLVYQSNASLPPTTSNRLFCFVSLFSSYFHFSSSFPSINSAKHPPTHPGQHPMISVSSRTAG